MLSKKGQQDLLSAVMLTGIMVVVVGSVYFWGIPLVQKNRDVNALQNSEDFMKMLNDKIKSVANNAGREQIILNVPAILTFAKDADQLRLMIDTAGSIYSYGGDIPLSRAEVILCGTATVGVWGKDQPEILCVKTTKVSNDKYTNVYTLKYRTLENEDHTKTYQIDLTGNGGSIGQDHNIVIEYDGSFEQQGILYTKVKITLL